MTSKRLLVVVPVLFAFACGEDRPSSTEETDSGISSESSDDPTGDGDGDPTTGDGDGDPTTGDGDGDPTGDPGECVVTECSGKVYQCGNCEDDDDDGMIDTADPNCWGPCDNNEAGFKGNIPGQNQAPCTVMDCYFDGDSGTGNDSCYWSHSCDPSEPNPSECTYNSNSQIPGSGLDCETGQTMQADLCSDVCGPLTPNGCDCFGCCDVTSGGQTYTVFLGTGGDAGTCSIDVVADPESCAPCIQVDGCLNSCESDDCELCIGETELPDHCEEPACPDGIQACDPVNNSSDCPLGMFCVTGCCYPSPE